MGVDIHTGILVKDNNTGLYRPIIAQVYTRPYFEKDKDPVRVSMSPDNFRNSTMFGIMQGEKWGMPFPDFPTNGIFNFNMVDSEFLYKTIESEKVKKLYEGEEVPEEEWYDMQEWYHPIFRHFFRNKSSYSTYGQNHFTLKEFQNYLKKVKKNIKKGKYPDESWYDEDIEEMKAEYKSLYHTMKWYCRNIEAIVDMAEICTDPEDVMIVISFDR